MRKWIVIIFQLLIIDVHALNVFQIDCNLDNQTGSLSCGSFTSYRNTEEDRVGNFYAPNDSTAIAIGNAINDTNRQFNDIFKGLSEGQINKDNLSDIITSVGSNYSSEQQQLFINNILGKSAQFKDSSVIPVVAYLADIRPVILNSKTSEIFNNARLKTSAAITKAIKGCEEQGCSRTSLQVTQNALNELINTAINNSLNADYLERWGEDTSFVNESQQDFKNLIDGLESTDLNDVIKGLEKQKQIEQEISNIASEWDIPLESVEIKGSDSPLKDYADNLIKYKRCLKSESECQFPYFGNTSPDYINQYKQLESIYKTTSYVRKSNIQAHYKESAFGYLNLSSDALISGNIESSKQFEEIATSIVDIGLGIIPVVSIGKDVYELFTGKNLVTGEELSTFERGFAAVGILTAGGAHYIQAAAKVLSEAKEVSKLALTIGTRVAESAVKIGANSSAKIQSFTKSFVRNPKLVEKVEEITEKIVKSKAFTKAINDVPESKAMFYVKETGEAIPSTSYKYIDSSSPELQKILKEGNIPARTAQKPHYATFNKFESAEEAMDKLQLAKKPDGTPWNNARYRVEFDTFQNIDEIEVPRGMWGEADYLEPITKDYPDFGQGGATQIIFKGETKVTEVVDLETGKVIYSNK